MDEPDFIQDILKTHKIVQEFSKYGVMYNKVYHNKLHFQQWYGLACGHKENEVDDNTCSYCLKKGEEGMECTSAKSGSTRSVFIIEFIIAIFEITFCHVFKLRIIDCP